MASIDDDRDQILALRRLFSRHVLGSTRITDDQIRQALGSANGKGSIEAALMAAVSVNRVVDETEPTEDGADTLTQTLKRKLGIND